MLALEMPEKHPTESHPPAPPRGSGGGRRRGRRGGRGRRRPAPATQISELPPEPAVQTESPAPQIEPPIRVSEMPVRPKPSKPQIQAAHSVVRADRPDGSAVSRAVEEVQEIVESLEQSLEQMEEVLRLVELAEHQKSDDEREIESLRRALRKFHQPRGGHGEHHEP